MKIEILKSKIHKVTITESNLNYIGSIAIDKDLLEASNIIIGEKVQVLNIDNGERLETYVIEGKKGSGEITLNGPAARKMHKGDRIIIISYILINMKKAKSFKPIIIFPNESTNKIN